MRDRAQADKLIEEYRMCLRAHVKNRAVELQIEKYALSPLYWKLDAALKYGTDEEVTEAYQEMLIKYSRFKEKLTMMILGNGSI
jgi:hypothetical protein